MPASYEGREIKEKAGFLRPWLVHHNRLEADDYEQFQDSLNELRERLWDWHQMRGKKVREVRIEAHIHPWIAGRVREQINKLRTLETHQFLRSIPLSLSLIALDGEFIEQRTIEPEPS